MRASPSSPSVGRTRSGWLIENGPLLAAVLTLAACGQPQAKQAALTSSPLCTQFDRQKSPDIDKEAFGRALDCAHHTAASFAGGGDSADVIAESVPATCFRDISQAASDQVRDGVAGSISISRSSLERYLIGEARIEVLRQRAGRCPPSSSSN